MPIPPPQKMVREFQLPEHTSGFFSEIVSKESARYQSVYPIKRGTLYSTVQGGEVNTSASFSPLYFLKEQRYGESDTLVIWVWATDQNAADSWNAAVEYSGDSTSHPVYARIYTIRRDVYDATPSIATGSALTALIAIKVTAGGTGYAATDTVNIAGGGGATAELVVSSAGVIQNVIVTNCGSGYDSAALPAITITTATGAGATLTAVVQTKTAVLTSQKKQEIGRDPQNGESTFSSEFVRLVRIYEVLPGPWIPWTRWDNDLGPIQGRRRAVLNSSQAPSLTATLKKTYEGREGSSIVSWEIEEVWSDGTGGPGNPAYPILTKKGYDPETGAAMTTTRQLVVLPDSPDVLGDAAGAGFVIDSEIGYYNAFLGIKTTVTMALPGSRTERESIGFQFPARFLFLGSWSIPGLCSGATGPYPGVDFTLSAHRTASKAASTVISYTNGQSGVAMPATWIVTTPGNASRLFPIQDNTIHNAILMSITCGAGSETIEDLPASTPSSYTPGDTLTIKASERRWKGPFWERRVTTIAE